MPKGIIKFYNAEKGFGFIKQDQGEDLFFHISSSDIEDPENLTVGQRVIYEIAPGRKGPEARELTIEEGVEDLDKKETSNEQQDKDLIPSESKHAKQSNKLISNVFWDTYIESGEAVTFSFLDDTHFQAKVLGRDTYHITVEVDGKERLIFKHALKWVEGTE